ncbi:hypothetical protein BJ878DRAFT_526623 [Calycina marina]|uniref:Uncharacterized protein n=1 Tax=Calycina marina TaxID=1763456 RepID=A0A9P7YV48_9HELO|nr:hypothetical protein BJ878DRAFT_526623 [Calycina marina]
MVQITLALATMATSLFQLATAAPAHLVDFTQAEETFHASVINRTATSLTKRYTDGEGTYVTSDSVHHYASGVKCWNDWFLVSQAIDYLPWEVSSGKQYCTGTDSCYVASLSGKQHCETTSITINAGVTSEIFTLSVSYGYDVQDCVTASDTSACIWTDGQCHVVWTQQQILKSHGYTRRRCNENGDYTAWMEDYENSTPTSIVNYGCGSSCDDSA